ncbi:MAG TPA: CARDB domain-containing protein [Thermoanaerobaculia bacterium]|nr:CARDB domain-containing protein [Thermoanaerobaculia bacterium]
MKAPLTLTGNTCGLGKKSLTNYKGCDIDGVAYPEPEAVYKVWLHEGNNVKFDLSMDKSMDLALVLLQPCNEASCRRSSDSTTKGAPESLSMRSYLPGFYFLSIDATSGPCGNYALTVTGVNPVPDLKVTLTGPASGAVGGSLKYDLSVVNQGPLDAPGTKVTVTLSGVTISKISGCPAVKNVITCTAGLLQKSSGNTFKVSINVTPAKPGTLSATATATAQDMGQSLGDQNPGDNQDVKVNTKVTANARHRHRRHAPHPYPGGTPRPV